MNSVKPAGAMSPPPRSRLASRVNAGTLGAAAFPDRSYRPPLGPTSTGAGLAAPTLHSVGSSPMLATDVLAAAWLAVVSLRRRELVPALLDGELG
jgi:hypothetical protein